MPSLISGNCMAYDFDNFDGWLISIRQKLDPYLKMNLSELRVFFLLFYWGSGSESRF